jgi:hypothetical protein
VIALVEGQVAEADDRAHQPGALGVAEGGRGAGAIAGQRAQLPVERHQPRVAPRHDQRAIELRAGDADGGSVGPRSELDEQQRRARHRHRRGLRSGGVGGGGGDDQRADGRQVAGAVVEEVDRPGLGERRRGRIGAGRAARRRGPADLGRRPREIRGPPEGQPRGHPGRHAPGGRWRGAAAQHQDGAGRCDRAGPQQGQPDTRPLRRHRRRPPGHPAGRDARARRLARRRGRDRSQAHGRWPGVVGGRRLLGPLAAPGPRLLDDGELGLSERHAPERSPGGRLPRLRGRRQVGVGGDLRVAGPLLGSCRDPFRRCRRAYHLFSRC